MGKVVFLGVEDSGKTTLAMALTKAFARHADEGWYLRPEGRGAYNFATIAPGDFATDGFPAQTSAAREMTWKISRDDVDKGDIQILDYPGEIYRLAFLTAEDEADPDAFRARGGERGRAHRAQSRDRRGREPLRAFQPAGRARPARRRREPQRGVGDE